MTKELEALRELRAKPFSWEEAIKVLDDVERALQRLEKYEQILSKNIKTNKSVDELVLWLGLELGEIYVSTTKWWYKLCYKEGRGFYFKVKDGLNPYSDFNTGTKEITALTLHQLLNLRKLKELNDNE